MRILTPQTLFRVAACIMLVLSAGNIAAQSAADQAIKTLPQTIKDNGENHVVTKSNTVSNNAMNKVDSAGNKALKGFTGLFKKKNKKKAGGDSTGVHPVDSTGAPKPSSYNRILPLSNQPRTNQEYHFFQNAFFKIDQV
ncbi:MAG TPA: hypothetical protein VNV35_13510 [Puia sp.]|jgi:hypothetical protein|nr:hypothetical protein [Puia sp.]